MQAVNWKLIGFWSSICVIPMKTCNICTHLHTTQPPTQTQTHPTLLNPTRRSFLVSVILSVLITSSGVVGPHICNISGKLVIILTIAYGISILTHTHCKIRKKLEYRISSRNYSREATFARFCAKDRNMQGILFPEMYCFKKYSLFDCVINEIS